MTATRSSSANLAPESLLGPRVLAWLIDAALLTILLLGLHFSIALFGLLTFGLGWAGFALLPLVPALYTILFLLSPGAATPGMRLCSLSLREAATGAPPGPILAVAWTLLYIASVTLFCPILLFALIDPQHRTLHDRLSGLVMVRH